MDNDNATIAQFTALDQAVTLSPLAYGTGVAHSKLMHRRTKRRRLAGGSIATLVVAMSAIGAVTVVSRPDSGAHQDFVAVISTAPVGQADYQSQLEWQASFSDYVATVLGVAERDPSYAGSRLDFATRSFTIYGVGNEPAALVNLIDSHPPQVNTVWQPSPYTAHQISTAARTIQSTLPDLAGVEWNAQPPIVVLIRPDDARDKASVLTSAQALTDIPVTISVSEPTAGVEPPRP